MLLAFGRQEKSLTGQLLFAVRVGSLRSCQGCCSSAQLMASPLHCTSQSWRPSHRGGQSHSSLKTIQDYEKTWEHLTSSAVAESPQFQPDWDTHGMKRARESLEFPEKSLISHLLLLFNAETRGKQTCLERKNMEIDFGIVGKGWNMSMKNISNIESQITAVSCRYW